ncbi:DUF397 domain-containing protein [Streptomyces sp. NPDC049627]|uniref:DUF397 domain-containing protein n=1 Tax=Streptomyces sp. NPDC049627 TaxID=3365595 RepID=UPI0037B1E422
MREYDLSSASWRKSSYSGGNGGEDCVEVADGVPGVVPVRDSKLPSGDILMIGADAWAEFIAAIR